MKRGVGLGSLGLCVEQLDGEGLDAALPLPFPRHQHLLLLFLLIQKLSPPGHPKRLSLDLLRAFALLLRADGVHEDFLESFTDFCHFD